MSIKRIILSSLFVAGCGSDATPVKNLSQAEQIELCEQFRTDVCKLPDFSSFCAKSCLQTCATAASAGTITAECSDTTDSPLPTDDAVTDCGATGSLDACIGRGGGCMFDALEDPCP